MNNMPERMKGSLWRRNGTRADYRVNAVVAGARVELMHLRSKRRHWVSISKITDTYQWILRPGPEYVVPTTFDEEEMDDAATVDA